MPRDRREIDRQFLALHKAYLEGVKRTLGDPPGFPNCIQPFDLGMGDDPLGYAIYWSPLPFVERLLDLGSDPNYSDPCGFPSLSPSSRPRTNPIGTSGCAFCSRMAPRWTSAASTIGRR
jgi:hypothetical protein